jgi:type IV pilus assembly protein PilV
MWADPDNLATYVETNTDISSLLPSGARTVAQTVDAGTGITGYRVTITWQLPGESQHTFTTTANITGG